MRTIAEWLFDRWHAGGDAWTIKVCYRDGTRVEYAVCEVLCDGVIVEYVNVEDRDKFGRFTVTFAALAWVQILEEGE